MSSGDFQAPVALDAWIAAARDAGMGSRRLAQVLESAVGEFETELHIAKVKRGYLRLFRDCQWSGHEWQRDTSYRPAEVYNCHECCASVFSDGSPSPYAKGFFGNRAAAHVEPGLPLGPMETYPNTTAQQSVQSADVREGR